MSVKGALLIVSMAGDYRQNVELERILLLQGSGDRHGPQRGWRWQSLHGFAFAFFAPKGHDVQDLFEWEWAFGDCHP